MSRGRELPGETLAPIRRATGTYTGTFAGHLAQMALLPTGPLNVPV